MSIKTRLRKLEEATGSRNDTEKNYLISLYALPPSKPTPSEGELYIEKDGKIEEVISLYETGTKTVRVIIEMEEKKGIFKKLGYKVIEPDWAKR